MGVHSHFSVVDMLPREQQQVMKFNWPSPYRRSNPSGMESNPKGPALELHKDGAPENSVS